MSVVACVAASSIQGRTTERERERERERESPGRLGPRPSQAPSSASPPRPRRAHYLFARVTSVFLCVVWVARCVGVPSNRLHLLYGHGMCTLLCAMKGGRGSHVSAYAIPNVYPQVHLLISNAIPSL